MKKAIAIAQPLDLRGQEFLSDAIRKESKRLFGFIKKRVASEADAEDILQDTFYQLAVNYDEYDPIERVASWLMTVASNRITDWYRKKKPVSINKSIVTNGSEEDDSLYLHLSNLIPDNSGPEDMYMKELIWDELNDALDELPFEQSEVFRMHELDGLDFKEISRITGVQVNTLLSRKRYAVNFLRKRLKVLYDEL